MRNVEQVDLDLAAARCPRLSEYQLREAQRFAWRRNPWDEELPRLDDLQRLPEADVPGVARTGW